MLHFTFQTVRITEKLCDKWSITYITVSSSPFILSDRQHKAKDYNKY